MARSRGDALILAGAAVTAARVVRRNFTARLFSRFASIALRRGMRSGSRGWLYASAAATGLHLLTRFVARRESVLSVKLDPGQAIEVRHFASAPR
jgi:hypothetical protein